MNSSWYKIPRHPATSRPAGFTLMELLVVITILAILAALLFPVIGRVKESSRAAECVSNLRMIGVAFHSYAADNNNLFPAARWTNRGAELEQYQNKTKRNWQSEIQAYFDPGKTYPLSRDPKDPYRAVFCPTFQPEWENDPAIQKLQASGYGIFNGLAANVVTDSNNKKWSSWDVRFNKLRIEEPSLTILAGDSDDYFLKITTDLAPNPNTGYFNGYSDRCGDPIRHGETANYLFVDGHVSKMTQAEAAESCATYSGW